MRVWSLLMVLGASGAVSCATPPPPPPTLDLSHRSCMSGLETGSVQTLPADGSAVTTKIDDTASCRQLPDGSRSSYRIFSLPAGTTQRMVTVASTPIGAGIFAPQVWLLDADYRPLRQLSGEAFLFRGSQLVGSARLHPGDRYVLIGSNPEQVGTEISRLQASTNSSVMSAGMALMTVHTGSEAHALPSM